MDQPHTTMPPAGDSPRSSEGLGQAPEIPRRWYCNKCGHLGEAGPVHNVCGGYADQQCQYHAVPHGPYWGEQQVREMLAAERERWQGVVARADDLLCRMNEAPATQIRESWKQEIRRGIVALRTGGPNARLSGPQRP